MPEGLPNAGAAGSFDTSSVESLVIVDRRVAEWRQLTADLPAGSRLFALDPDADGLEQIAEITRGIAGLSSIHILSHGAPGALQIGSGMVDRNALDHASDALRAIGAALKPGGDLLLYGCDVGQGAEGSAFVARLAALTGANVAASSGKVGAAELGGDWVLDVATADITAPLAFSAAARSAYAGVLPVSFTFVSDPLGQINAGSGEGRMVYGDFDNDGDIDVLFQSSNVAGSGFGYFANNGSGSFTRFSNINTDATGTPFVGFNFAGQQLTALLSIDLDNDGDIDILDRDAGGNMGIWRNNGGSFSFVADPLGQINAGAGEGRLITGDFDNDGDADILYQAGSTLGSGFGYFRNDGNLSFTEFTNANAAGTPFAGFSFTGQQMSPTALLVIDIDNDGDDDILDRNNTSGDGSLSLWRNDNGSFSNQADPLGQINAGTAEARMIAGDFDSDGDVDILFQAGAVAGTGFGYLRNDGAGSFTKFANANDASTPFAGFSFTGQQLTSLAAIDFDNDGDIDILDRDYTGAGAGVWSQAGTGNGAPPRLVSSTPADNSGSVAVGANIVLTFNEAVTGGSGLIQIHRASDGAVVASIAGNSGQVTGSGTSTITINPISDLAGGTSYYVTFQERAFVDGNGATFGVLEGVERNGITSPTFLNFTTAAANTAPTTGTNAGLTLNEGASGTITSARLDINDAEQPDSAITLTITSAATNGTMFRNGVALGVNDSFTQADINANLITYTHNGSETTSGSFVFTISDGAGGSTSGLVFNFTITPVNDAPTLTGDFAATVDEGGFYVLTTTDLNFTDPDDVAAGVVFAATNLVNGSILVNGVALNTFTGTQLSLGQVRFVHDGSETASASFNVSVEDGNEDGSVPGSSTFNLTVNAVNDAPALTGDLFASFAEGGSYVLTTTDLNFTDPDDGAAGVTFTVSSQVNGTVLVNGVASTTFTGAQLAAGLVSFLHNGSETLVASFSVSVEDGNEDASAPGSSTFNFNITPVDDAGVAQNDSFGASEATQTLSGNVFANNGSGADTDVDSALSVAAVNGSTTVIGDQITLASGALLTVNADGTFDYDQNGAFDYVPDSASGGINLIGTDSFTYALENGGTATVTITIGGIDSEGDQVTGDANNNILDGGIGADTMAGNTGADTYMVDNAGDVVSEVGGAVNEIDRVFSSVSVDLSDPTHFIGLIEAVQLTGSSNLDIIGNNQRNLLIGNQGANVIDGGLGKDSMWGRGGNDTYIVDDIGDLVDESLGGSSGTDLVQASVSFNLGDTAQVRGAVENLTLTGSVNANAAGNSLANILVGNSGANIIAGGGGADTLTGGGANDVFLFNAALGGGNVDTITDMNEAGNDTIWLDDAIFTALGIGTLIPNAFAISATGALDATDRIIYNSANGQLSYDSDGTGSATATLFAILDAGLGLTYADFRVV